MELCKQCPAKITFHVKSTPGIKKAIALRLSVILAEMERDYEHWQQQIRDRLNATRRAQVERAWMKKIQAMKITIYTITPNRDRTTDMPALFVKKEERKAVATADLGRKKII